MESCRRELRHSRLTLIKSMLLETCARGNLSCYVSIDVDKTRYELIHVDNRLLLN